MINTLNFQLSNSKFSPSFSLHSPLHRPPSHLRLPINRHASFSLHSLSDHLPPPPASESEPSISSEYVASVGSTPSSFSLHCNFSQRHILILNVIACAAAISATWLFVSAIPTLLAFKRAANSLEKLMDATREELPDTMAAIRLSGMEISDLTMELSDLGQEISQGVRNSTRAVRVAEERLRDLTNTTRAPPASLQRASISKTERGEPAVARTARGIKEGLVKGRAILQMFFALTHFSKIALNYFKKRARK